MSKEANAAFYRLSVKPRIDGTALLVLYYLCQRHNEKTDTAWPSLTRISVDLDVARRTLVDALKRLELAHLISRNKGRGRGNSTHYRLPFLDLHRARPGKDSINWPRNKGGSPHFLERKFVRSSVSISAVERSEIVQSTAPENNKTIKQDADVDTDVDCNDKPTSKGSSNPHRLAALRKVGLIR